MSEEIQKIYVRSFFFNGATGLLVAKIEHQDFDIYRLCLYLPTQFYDYYDSFVTAFTALEKATNNANFVLKEKTETSDGTHEYISSKYYLYNSK